MQRIGVRELRNDVSAVLRRVEAGEHLTVTVNGRPVAELGPIDPRPMFRSWEWFESIPKADPGLAGELRELHGDETTDDVIARWL
ncbi:MAG: type II toxin-antitoxin system Phd/YefM family antitoxin [Candidatus Dormibacteraceae bacterium]